MSFWPHLFFKPEHSTTDFQEGRLNWEDALQAQQHFWNDWVEAGQLWMSWWVSTLPPVGWPPAGVVLPPALSNTASFAPDTDSSKTAQDLAAANEKTIARKPRAPVVRHH